MPAKLKPTIQNPEENPRQYMEDQMANYRRLRKAHPKAKTCISDSGNKNFHERQLTPQSYNFIFQYALKMIKVLQLLGFQLTR